MVFLSLIPNCTNPVCVLCRQREGKWKSIWVAGRAMHHSCFFKRCFTQRSLKKVVSDLTAWTSFRNAGTGWKLKLGEWVCSWLCFLFLQNDRDSSLFPWFSSVETGQGFRQRVSFSQAFWYSGLWHRDAAEGSMSPCSITTETPGSGSALEPGTRDFAGIHPGWEWEATATLLWLLAGEMGLIDSGVFWFIPGFSQVLDLYLPSTKQSFLILKAGKSVFPFPVMLCFPVVLECFLWSSLNSSCSLSEICSCSHIVFQCNHDFTEFRCPGFLFCDSVVFSGLSGVSTESYTWLQSFVPGT